MEWLSVCGAIASIVGAAWSVWQAHEASKSADKAEEMRNELSERRQMVEVSQLYAETKRILRAIAAVGPSCSPAKLRGVNCGGIADDVNEYRLFVSEQRDNFGESFCAIVQPLCDDLASDIEALAEASSYDEKKSAGKRIHAKLMNFMPTVKALADEKRERPR